jgi:hypothetical protein
MMITIRTNETIVEIETRNVMEAETATVIANAEIEAETRLVKMVMRM